MSALDAGRPGWRFSGLLARQARSLHCQAVVGLTVPVSVAWRWPWAFAAMFNYKLQFVQFPLLGYLCQGP